MKRTLLFLIAAFPVFALGQSSQFGNLKYWNFGLDPREASLSAAAKNGLEAIYAGDGFYLAMPLKVQIRAERIKKATSLLSAGIDDKTDAGKFRVFGLLPSPSNRPSNVTGQPLSLSKSYFSRNSSVYGNNNCFMCHAGVVNGIVTAGVGNTNIDQVSMLTAAKKLSQMPKLLLNLNLSPDENRNLKIFLDDLKVKVEPIMKHSNSRGDNMGPFAVWRILSRLKDPFKLGLESYSASESSPLDQFIVGPQLPTVDPNPWWTLKYKQRVYWYGDASTSDANHFSINFTTLHENANDTHETHVNSIKKILAFARNTTPPPYPESLNEEQIKLGAEIFHGERPISNSKVMTCFKCHGSYTRIENGWKVNYSSNSLKDVGTDPEYNQLLKSLKPLSDHGNQLSAYYRALGRDDLIPQSRVPDENENGYLPPVLVGIWASAPYFHNGSVPTLRAVLNSRIRPLIWKKNNISPTDYNHQDAGLAYQTVSPSEWGGYQKSIKDKTALNNEAINYRSIYHTQLFGKSNLGHRFGDELAEIERTAVIEFLKSLSGPNLPIGP